MARLCTLKSPLGDKLFFSEAQFTERLSEPFTIHLTALSPRMDIRPEELLGKPITIQVDFDPSSRRFFNGFVTRFELGEARGRHYVYRMVLRPWIWFLKRTSDCRVFQDKTVPDVVAEVFHDEPAQAVERSVSGSHRPWEYCVQYRETDYNFVARLLEQEGIAYFFEHQDDRHTLVLVDGKGGHKPVEGSPSLRFLPTGPGEVVLEDRIEDWSAAEEIQSGQYALADYDFKNPRNALSAVRKPEYPAKHVRSKHELFDYPAEYDTFDEIDTCAGYRAEEMQAQAVAFRGEGALRHFQAGRRFKLADHPRKDQNGEYLLTEVSYSFSDPPPTSSSQSPASSFRCRFAAIRADQQFRPPRLTPKPIVQGIQTAEVVGPAGEEIHTDEYGRVRVRFHWDRHGKRDETASCWLRVAFPVAGSGHGFVAIPRVGQEVVVSFLEGDPDWPMVTGVVYNKANMPPWSLPANKTQSGFLTRSSERGGQASANALRFEDKKGDEQLWIHAERDLDVEAEHDQTLDVGNDRNVKVGGNETRSVGSDQTESVGGNVTVTISGNHELTAQQITLTAQATITLKAGASTIELGPSGITINGPLVRIN
jgi:type VI secretion system secreted protein VgrG